MRGMTLAPPPPLSQASFIRDISPRERSLWRFVVTLLAGIAAGFVVGLVVGLVALIAFAVATGGLVGGVPSLLHQVAGLIGDDGATLQSALALLTLATATNVPVAAVFIIVATAIAGRRFTSYVTAAPKIRWKLLASGLLLSFAVIGPLVAASQLLDPHAAPAPLFSLAKDWPGQVGYAVACFALLIPAAAAEELLFRGWLLRESAALSRNPVFLMALNGVLFSAVHAIGAPSELAPGPFLTRALMGAGFVYMTLRLGGLEFSTGAHAANNILIVLFIQPLSTKATPPGGFGLDSVFQDTFLFVSYLLMAEFVARWPLLRRWSGADQAPGPTATAVVEHFS